MDTTRVQNKGFWSMLDKRGAGMQIQSIQSDPYLGLKFHCGNEKGWAFLNVSGVVSNSPSVNRSVRLILSGTSVTVQMPSGATSARAAKLIVDAAKQAGVSAKSLGGFIHGPGAPQLIHLYR